MLEHLAEDDLPWVGAMAQPTVSAATVSVRTFWLLRFLSVTRNLVSRFARAGRSRGSGDGATRHVPLDSDVNRRSAGGSSIASAPGSRVRPPLRVRPSIRVRRFKAIVRVGCPHPRRPAARARRAARVHRTPIGPRRRVHRLVRRVARVAVPRDLPALRDPPFEARADVRHRNHRHGVFPRCPRGDVQRALQLAV